MKALLKKIAPYFACIILLLVISIATFSPQLDGKVLPAGDISSSIAKSKQVNDYQEQTGEKVFWNPSQFSGMPFHLLNMGRDSNLMAFLDECWNVVMDRPMRVFFKLGLLFFLSLAVLRINPWLALAFSIVYMFSTHFFILAEAGHYSKLTTVSYLPLILAGFILLLKKYEIRGALTLLVGISLALYSRHIQMTYYFLMLMVLFSGIMFRTISDKGGMQTYLKAIGIGVIIAALAGLSNFAQLNASQEFSKSTMRGEPILQKADEAIAKSSSEVDGLEWSYSMSWSFEWSDVMGTMIPRMVGGGSGERIDKEHELAKLMMQNGTKADRQGQVTVPGYWSTMRFTSGPPYLGITLVFLFLFVIIALRKPMYIAFGAMFIFAIFLSLGENLEWLNRLFFNHLPLFNKFRAPSSIIAIVPGFVAMAAALGLQEISEIEDKKQYLKWLYISVGVVAGFTAFIALFGSALFSFLSPNDANYPANVQGILIATREALQQADAWRSFFFVLATGGAIWLYLNEFVKPKLFVPAALSLLFLVDMVPVDRRYVTSDDYISKFKYEGQFIPRAADKQIAQLETKGRGYYRVLDLSTNTFNDAKPAYYHNQIGGYDPAKMQRYQDLIDYHISKNNMEVLNMLNAKYVISREGTVQTNGGANGTSWFVSNVQNVADAQAEIDALNGFNSKTTAVVNTEDFGSDIQSGNGQGTISLTSYAPNSLSYQSNSSSEQLAVFSEIWYGGNPDWTATIDGEPANFIRVNYVLRALEVPAGNHTILFEFKPKVKGALISKLASGLSFLLLLAGIGYGIKNFSEEEEIQAGLEDA